jgi:hypothetical protein
VIAIVNRYISIIMPPADDPLAARRPNAKTVHDALLAWFTTPRLQDELLARDREAVKHVLDLLRRRVRKESRFAHERIRVDSRGRGGPL